jgi:hypothetical protein
MISRPSGDHWAAAISWGDRETVGRDLPDAGAVKVFDE